MYSRAEIRRKFKILHQARVLKQIDSRIFSLQKRLKTSKSYEFDDVMVNDGLYSALMEYNLLCDKQIIATIISSMTFVSFFIGAAISGMVSDKFGR